MSRLKDLYNNEIVDAMTKKFGYANVMEVPKLDKIVINMGVGEAKENAKILENAVADMEAITGQKAVLTKAKNSVANFKIREVRPLCVVRRCMSSWIVWLTSLFLVSVTSEALTLTHSTAEVTMHSVSKSSSSSLRSSTIRLTRPEVWISFS